MKIINVLVRVFCVVLIAFFVWFGLDPNEMKAKKQDQKNMKEAAFIQEGQKDETDTIKKYNHVGDGLPPVCFVPQSSFERRKAVLEGQVYTTDHTNIPHLTNTCDGGDLSWGYTLCMICKF